MRVYVLTTNIIYPGRLIAFALVYTSLILMFVYGFLVQHIHYVHYSFGSNCLQSLCTLSASLSFLRFLRMASREKANQDNLTMGARIEVLRSDGTWLHAVITAVGDKGAMATINGSRAVKQIKWGTRGIWRPLELQPQEEATTEIATTEEEPETSLNKTMNCLVRSRFSGRYMYDPRDGRWRRVAPAKANRKDIKERGRGHMQIHVSKISGETTTIFLKATNYVRVVKESIVETWRIPVHQQCLSFDQQVLQDCCTLAMCGIEEKSTLTLTVTDTMEVFIKAVNGALLRLIVCASETLDTLRAKIEELGGITAADQHITYKDCVLEQAHGDRTLQDCHIRHLSTIHIDAWQMVTDMNLETALCNVILVSRRGLMDRDPRFMAACAFAPPARIVPDIFEMTHQRPIT